MAGTSSNRAEEFARISSIEQNNRRGAKASPNGVVKHSGIGTSLTKNSVSGGGINRSTKPTSQR